MNLQKIALPHYMLFLAFVSTGLNLICGLLGIYYASNEQNIEMALRLLIAGAFFDVLDGRFARRAPTKSELGVYADSFADLFTFALLPSYMALQTTIFLGNQVIFSNITILFLIAVFYSFAGWFRLVRFSVKPTGVMFQGLPSSAAAMFLGAFITLSYQYPDLEILQIMVTCIMIFVAILMMSKISYPSPKRMWKPDNYLFASASVIGLIYIFFPNIISLLLICLIFATYIFLGPIYYRKSEEILGSKT